MVNEGLRQLVLTIFLIFLFKGTSGNVQEITDFQKIYETSKPGEMPCYYTGHFCKRGEKYCSVKSKTCEPLFGPNDSEDMKMNYCRNLIHHDNTTILEQGTVDSCIYFFGMMAVKKGDHLTTIKNDSQGPQPLHTPGLEYCPPANAFCQLGNEICNYTSRMCENIFPAGANDDVKRRNCQDVIKTNTTLRDVCIYALGTLYSHTENTVDSGYSKYWFIGVTVSLVAIIITLVVIIFRRKCPCWKQTHMVPGVSPDLKREGERVQEDIAMGNEVARQNLLNQERVPEPTDTLD